MPYIFFYSNCTYNKKIIFLIVKKNNNINYKNHKLILNYY